MQMRTREVLRTQCADLGLEPGDAVMLHVSLRALGPVLSGPDSFIDAVMDAVGPRGTLLVYVGCEAPYDDIGSGRYDPAEEDFFRRCLPPFDYQTARACRDFGAFAELFRTYPGVICSSNPGARIAAVGGAAIEMTKDHPLNFGYGPNSPFERLYLAGGKVMLVGSDPDNVSILHYAEAIAPVQDKRTVKIETALLVDGKRQWVTYEETDTANGIRDWPADRFFAGIVDAYARTAGARTGVLGGAPTRVLDARGLVDLAIPIMVAEAGR